VITLEVLRWLGAQKHPKSAQMAWSTSWDFLGIGDYFDHGLHTTQDEESSHGHLRKDDTALK